MAGSFLEKASVVVQCGDQARIGRNGRQSVPVLADTDGP